MPFPNEHAARQADPDRFIRCRRQNNKGGKGVHFIICFPRGGGGGEIQSVRFDRKLFTPAQAKAWLQENGMSAESFEVATGESTSKGPSSRPT